VDREAALKNRQKHYVIDGEAVILGVDGYSDFNALHSGKHNEEVQLCAFDLLAMDGDDLRNLPLSMRKANLQRLLARRPEGIFISEFEQGEIEPDLFRAACDMGLEGLVSKAATGPIRASPPASWSRSRTASSRCRMAASTSSGSTRRSSLRVAVAMTSAPGSRGPSRRAGSGRTGAARI